MFIEATQIQERIEQMGKIVEAEPYMLPTYGWSDHSARPNIEVDEQGYHYIVLERGHENEHLITTDLDELLYRVFDGVTFELACRYELKHRKWGKDSRRILFACQEELLSWLNPAWGERRKREHEQILAQYPFEDGLFR